MANILNIFDVSSMLYAGQCAKAYSTKNDVVAESRNVEGLPIGGVRYTLRVALQKLKDDEDVLLVFDSKTDKQRVFQDYKGNRTFNPAIMVQQLMLRDAAEKIGIPLLQEDNFEADDLVAAVVQHYVYKYSEIYIYTGDTDLAANILDEHISIKGTASIYPSIDANNYEYAIKHGLRIQYNTILPYYAIYGKPSNNVPAIGEKSLCDKCYLSFLEYSRSANVKASRFSTIPHFASWLSYELNLEPRNLSLELIEQLYERIAYVFPRPYEKELNIAFIPAADLNMKELEFFLKVFNMASELMWFELFEVAAQTKSQAMIEYIKGYKNIYFTGTMAVDQDIPADSSFFNGSPSTFFIGEGDF